MEGIKGGGGRVGVGQAEDMTLDPMNCCINHPYKNNNNGGICAFCLQEKLGKLVSSSSPLPLCASSSSPSPPDAGLAVVGGGGTSLSMSGDHPTTKDDHNNNNNGTSHYQEYHTRRARNNIPLPKKKIMASSPSTTTTTSVHHHHHNHDHHDGIVLKRSKSTAITPRSTGRFWSFLYLSSKTQNGKRTDKIASTVNYHDDDADVRKVSRSRSVGCGSRSFSGDLFGKISTGLGDCTLRRVESQREPKPKPKLTTTNDGIRNSSTWGWALASPIRAFSSKKDKNSNTTTTTPNLSAIPSLLAT